MKKIIALLLLVVTVFSFAACGDSDVPDGMQLVRGGEKYGFYSD